jgi:type 1 glutamine amidotransferase
MKKSNGAVRAARGLAYGLGRGLARRFALAAGLALGLAGAAPAQAAVKMKVLVVTGGHDYDTAAFNALWNGLPDVEWTHRTLAYGHEVFENPDLPFDILVFYNHQDPGARLTQKHKDNFQAMLNRGLGLFVFHHATAAYPFWPEFEAVAGVKYRSANYYTDSLSTYKHDQTIPCSTLAGHPLSTGMPKNFTVTDEMYFKMAFAADNRILLTTSYAGAQGPMAWTRTRKKSRIFTTLLGHGPGVFSQPAFRQMLINGLNDIRPCLAGDPREACKGVVLAPLQAYAPAPARAAYQFGNGGMLFLRPDGEGHAETLSLTGRRSPLLLPLPERVPAREP